MRKLRLALAGVLPLFVFPLHNTLVAQPVRIVQDSFHDVSPPLREIGVLSKPSAGPLREMPEPGEPPEDPFRAKTADPVAQRTFGDIPSPAIPSTIANFAGTNNLDGVYPPDTNGDVGPNHYVQWVNLHLQVFNKTGTSLLGPITGNSIWSGFGAPCQTSNSGDPIVLYDSIADRWVISQFTSANPYGECVAVSTTADPTGSWYRYFFQFSTTIFYDYPHMGVWPDGYYLAENRFSGVSYVGSSAIVLDRARMLQGLSATFQEFQPAGPSSLLPSDLDGRLLPPAGSPNYFASRGSSTLNVYKFHVDWSTPANSTFTGPTSLSVASYNLLCSGTRSCIPQPATTVGLDGIGDRLMHRFAYRNFGDHESFVVSLSVDVDATATVQAAPRWYEVRNTPPGGTMSLYQQGTFAPDTVNRWLPAVAMDGSGNMGMGYSYADSSNYAGLRYTGRLAGDASGTMPQGEGVLTTGAGSQTGAASRWGDYAMMAVDPADDCTFWFTSEWMPSTGGAPWVTRIASFKFPTCAACTPPATPTITGSAAVCAGSPVTLTASAGYTSYQWYKGAAPIAGATSRTYAIASAAAADAGTYYVTGTISGCSSQQSGAFALTVGSTTPTAAASGSASICPGGSTALTGSGGVSCSWSPSTGLSDASSCSPSASPAATQIYTLTVTGANGCASTNNPTVTVTVKPVPSAAISAGSIACALSKGNGASVPVSAGATYLWTITGGSITSGQGTAAITYSAGSSGTVQLGITVTGSNGCGAAGSKSVPITAAGCGNFYSLAPCRILDTRNPAGPYGAPPLSAGASRTFVLANQCLVPPAATAVSANVTVTQPAAGGDLRLYAAGQPAPGTSVINFRTGQTRANNAVLALGSAGDIVILCDMPGSATVQVILDVNGYFE